MSIFSKFKKHKKIVDASFEEYNKIDTNDSLPSQELEDSLNENVDSQKSTILDNSNFDVNKSDNQIKQVKSKKKLKLSEVSLGEKSLFEATSFIQDMFKDVEGTEWLNVEEREYLTHNAMAGDKEAINKLCNYIEESLNRFNVIVHGMDNKKAAYEIYKYLWGLDVIEDLLNREDVDEVRINRWDKVYYQSLGKNYQSDIKFKDDEHVMKVIKRASLHDPTNLDRNKPDAEFIRYGGIRVTATYTPLSSCATAVFRKLRIDKTMEDLVSSKTLDENVVKILSTLVKGRSNVIITGGCGSGKTTMLRCLIKYLNKSLRIITIETDYEINASLVYPDRDIVEFAQQLHLDYTMRRIFNGPTLRYTPDVVITGELRSVGEAEAAIRSASRGVSGSLTTAHFDNSYDVPGGIARLLIEEGVRLPYELAFTMVAEAFNINIHLIGDSSRGKRIVSDVVEYIPDNRTNTVVFNQLIKWVQTDENDFFTGNWSIVGKPSERLVNKLIQNGVTMKELRELGWNN